MVTSVVGVAVVSAGRVLAARRGYPSALAGRWELPGGKVAPGETAARAAVREVAEELDCTVRVVRALPGVSRIDDDHALSVVVARLVGGEPVPHDHDLLRWLGPEELDEVGWLPTDRPFLPGLRALLLTGERLAGGNVGGAVRIGPTVRRSTGSWTPAVHALLAHLRAAGLSHVPAVLGLDGLGREVLTYLPGRVVDVDTEDASDEAVAAAMRWLREFHRAVADFEHPGPWRNATSPPAPVPSPTAVPGLSPPAPVPGLSMDPGPDRIICHHDFAPYNVALSSSATGDRLVGVFDWDMAGPGTLAEDLAFAAWNWVPLWRPRPATQVAGRLRLLAGSYDPDVSPRQVLAAVVPRIERSCRVIRAGQEAGDAGMLNLAAVGEPGRTAAALAGLRARLPAIEQALAG